MKSNVIKSVLLGVAIGDALGVPVEFKSRLSIGKHPVKDMMGHGTHNQPPGTWSDDSSLTFCLAEALTHDFDLNEVAQNFIQWLNQNYWTASASVFDVGFATRQAISKLQLGCLPHMAGGTEVSSNGNGSLMRILPLMFYMVDKPIDKRFELTQQVSSITHAHIHSVMACFYYLEFARYLFLGKDKYESYNDLQIELPRFFSSLSICPSDLALFDRLLNQAIFEPKVDDITSSGYVLHTLEASIWCIMTTDTFKSAVLKAVNLGDDTDTTGAVTGGLAGLLYGLNSIPKKWIKQIAKSDDILNLGERLASKLV